MYTALVESDLNEEIFYAYALGSNFITWYQIACMAKEMTPGCRSRITAEGEAGKPNLYCVDKIHRVFGVGVAVGENVYRPHRLAITPTIRHCVPASSPAGGRSLFVGCLLRRQPTKKAPSVRRARSGSACPVRTTPKALATRSVGPKQVQTTVSGLYAD